MAKTKSSKKPSKKAAKAPKPDAAVPATRPEPKTKKARDPRLPAVGETIVRRYKGRDIRVKMLEEGFECEGAVFKSLSALAAKVCETDAINGFLFFKLTGPKTPKPEGGKETETPAPAKKRAPKSRRAGRDPQPAATDRATEPAPAPETATA